jgi:hypothetical protein
VFGLAWFRDPPGIGRLGMGLGISRATGCRYLTEALEVLATRAPSLREALEKAKELRLPCLILDGTVVASDRCGGEGRPARRAARSTVVFRQGAPQRREYPGNICSARRPAVGLGRAVGSTHDLTAARRHVLPGVRPYLKDLPLLADSGCEGAGAGVHVSVKKPAGGQELDPDMRTRNALLRSLRYQGERGFALMSRRWRSLQRVMLSPRTIGDITKAALVLVKFEHKMIN